MAAVEPEAEIVLYDLACTKNVCFSPSVWRIRLILNYKRIPYRTIFLEFPDIEPTLKGLGLTPGESASSSKYKYTVPAIHHVPSNTYMMDSAPIANFLESTYPTPPLLHPPTPLCHEIETRARTTIAPVFGKSVMWREVGILTPRGQEYFRRTREEDFGFRLEDMLTPEQEEEGWMGVDGELRAVGKMMRRHKEEGPFVMGARPSTTDFFIAGSLQCARVVDEGVFQRNFRYEGFREVYEACLPYMERKD